jgi:hypothetical protein
MKNISLYEDKHPMTSKKGFGFKNKLIANKTIKELKKYPLIYQKQVIITMYNRAKYHPYQTSDMKEAMMIYKIWMRKHKIKINI